jgi:hypothetical protein
MRQRWVNWSCFNIDLAFAQRSRIQGLNSSTHPAPFITQ